MRAEYADADLHSDSEPAEYGACWEVYPLTGVRQDFGEGPEWEIDSVGQPYGQFTLEGDPAASAILAATRERFGTRSVVAYRNERGGSYGVEGQDAFRIDDAQTKEPIAIIARKSVQTRANRSR